MTAMPAFLERLVQQPQRSRPCPRPVSRASTLAPHGDAEFEAVADVEQVAGKAFDRKPLRAVDFALGALADVVRLCQRAQVVPSSPGLWPGRPPGRTPGRSTSACRSACGSPDAVPGSARGRVERWSCAHVTWPESELNSEGGPCRDLSSDCRLIGASGANSRHTPSSRAVTSTMGMIRSYAMRVGPITHEHPDRFIVERVRGRHRG